MNPSPIEYAESLIIGTVEFVSPNEIKASLDIEAPESVALNTGTPRPFPRVNSYVLIPSDEGFLVAQVEWLTIERSPYPKRRGMQDFGLVDLPYPLRKMSLNPLGTLARQNDAEGEVQYQFRRGADIFPTVGDHVILPTQKQLLAIVESGEKKRVQIGTSPLAGNARVLVDPNRLFGRHLAVLGNTGSGKSCSVAGLIRWSLEQASASGTSLNARFIVLDPNGEYSRAFGKETSYLKPRIFRVDPGEASEQLRVPLWFWNSAEWCSFAQASGKTQRPILKRALREVRAGRTGLTTDTAEEKKLALRRYFSAMHVQIVATRAQGLEKTEESKFGFRLKAYSDDLAAFKDEHSEYAQDISLIEQQIGNAIDATIKEYPPGNHYFRAFTQAHLDGILQPIVQFLEKLGGLLYQEGPEEDCPISFGGAVFADQVDLVARQQNVTQFVEFLTMRIRPMLSDTRMKAIISESCDIALDQWLTDYIGDSDTTGGSLTIIDLSLVPSEIIHLVTAVIARMIFDALQRYRKLHANHLVLPSVVVMEEAHTFIKRYKEDSDNQDAAAVCCQVFERIAREGRKFGLGLVLSSQRPSELSPTVLSQCNTFLLHRISNDRDQDLVHRFVPDNLKGLLRELPTLSSQNAILLGWASQLPVLIRMQDLPREQQPQSDDPDFWEVWTGKDSDENPVERSVNWKALADDWQGKPKPTEGGSNGNGKL